MPTARTITADGGEVALNGRYHHLGELQTKPKANCKCSMCHLEVDMSNSSLLTSIAIDSIEEYDGREPEQKDARLCPQCAQDRTMFLKVFGSTKFGPGSSRMNRVVTDDIGKDMMTSHMSNSSQSNAENGGKEGLNTDSIYQEHASSSSLATHSYTAKRRFSNTIAAQDPIFSPSPLPSNIRTVSNNQDHGHNNNVASLHPSGISTRQEYSREHVDAFLSKFNGSALPGTITSNEAMVNANDSSASHKRQKIEEAQLLHGHINNTERYQATLPSSSLASTLNHTNASSILLSNNLTSQYPTSALQSSLSSLNSYQSPGLNNPTLTAALMRQNSLYSSNYPVDSRLTHAISMGGIGASHNALDLYGLGNRPHTLSLYGSIANTLPQSQTLASLASLQQPTIGAINNTQQLATASTRDIMNVQGSQPSVTPMATRSYPAPATTTSHTTASHTTASTHVPSVPIPLKSPSNFPLHLYEGRPKRKLIKKSFDERFKELLEYKHVHGHCNVPSKCEDGYASLGNWCSNLRQSYKKIKEGKKFRGFGLTEENMKKLDEIGFKWYVPGGRKKGSCASRVDRHQAIVRG